MSKKLKIQQDPWYKDGLKFKCTECGKCCSGAPGYIWVDDDKIQEIADFLKLKKQEFMRRYLRFKDGRYSLIEKRDNLNYDCIFLEGKACSIYPVRPKQCRTFPWWKSNLESKHSWALAAAECEGISDDAPVIPLDLIEAQLHNN